MSSWRGILDFWRRMTSRLQDLKKPKPILAAATDEVRQQRTLHDTWKNGKEVPRWGVAEIQKMSPSTTGRCK